ncbi:MAG TPA: tetratricopeptide repeat protein [Candidatus Sulfotelmatobacter sp.]|jgi:lipopolysaccharide biosynthesis regulator YciM|nr:tetratricopeptide repeat protein [Candidatus Sulfotelmatobacter sp.]
MKLRTFLYILVAMGVTYAIITLFVANRDVLVRREFHFWGGLDLPVGLTLVLFLAAGVVITLLAGLTGEASRMLDGWRRQKASRTSEQIEEDYGRGLSSVLEGRDDEALAHFRAVLERDSRHFNTLLKLGEVLRGLGRFDEGIEYHRKAHHLKEDDARPLYALVDDYEAKGDLERARTVLGRIIALKKQSLSAWRKLRWLHMKGQNWTEALEAHQQVEKLRDGKDLRDASDARVGHGIRFEIGSALLADGKSKEAAAMFRKLIKDVPPFIPAHVRLGEALRAQGLANEAVECWFQGFEMTGSPILLTVLEDHFLAQEQPLAAIEALKRCVARARKDTLPRFYLGKLFFRLEMLDDAMAVLQGLEGRASYAPTLHYLLGRIHERRRNFREAASEYRKVVKEMELVALEYRCRACRQTRADWAPRCEHCGEWNSIEVDFREEISLDELGLSPAPVYTSRS